MNTLLPLLALCAGGARAVCAGGEAAAYFAENEDSLWEAWVAEYEKGYATAGEARARREVWRANAARYIAATERNPLANFGFDEHSDLHPDEFYAAHHLGRAPVGAMSELPVYQFTQAERAAAAAVDAIDWRMKNAVTNVKSQGKCGSCWAESAAGNIEGQFAAAGHPLASVSVQQLVSCAGGGKGCVSGWPENAYRYLLNERQGGVATDAAYPYTSGDAVAGACKDVSGMPVGATITNFTALAHNEEDMAVWVATKGPLSVVVDVESWWGYKGGVMTDCHGQYFVSHAVLLVGYGRASNVDYWIIKNSYGEKWGEQGYIRVKKGDDQCRITFHPTSAIV